MAEGKKEEKMLYDAEKPSLDVVEVALPMETVYQTELLGDLCKEAGVKYLIGLLGGHVWYIETVLMKRGIPRVHVHHEAVAVFAADAYARITGKPGMVTYLTAGPGWMNTVTPHMQAKQAQAPFVSFIGSHATYEDGRGPIQEGYAEATLGGNVRGEMGVTKWTKRIVSERELLYWTARAFRECQHPPMGPCAIDVPYNIIYIENARKPRWEFTGPLSGYAEGFFPPRPHRTMGDPEAIKRAMEWFLAAEKPCIVVGEGVHYDDAAPELNEFIELTGIPCHTRRVGRSVFPEHNYLNCYGRARGRVFRACDRMLVLGLRVAYLEEFGYPPFWSHETRYWQAQQCLENICLALPTEHEVIGNLKHVLRQMIDYAKEMGIKSPPEKWNGWRQFVREAREAVERRILERTEKMKGVKPIHPDIAGRYIAEYLRDEENDEPFVILDGFTSSSFLTDWIRAKRGAQVLDSSETMGIGHGVGMAIGAGLATDRKIPIFAMMGDTGFQAYMGDIETAIRWDIPVLYFVNNNSGTAIAGWEPFFSVEENVTGIWERDSWGCTKNIPYHEIFKNYGIHTELVEDTEEIKPALKRSFDWIKKTSKPAVVNAIIDPEPLMDGWAAWFCILATHIPWDRVPEKGKEWYLSGKGLGAFGLSMYYPEGIEEARRRGLSEEEMRKRRLMP